MASDETQPSTTEIHDLELFVIEGTVRLRGPDFDGSTLQVSAKVPVLVRVHDDANNYVYVTEIPPRGERASCWGRNTNKGLSRRLFDEVVGETSHVVFAIGKSDAALAYGPIIKVKPKGG